MFQQDWLGKYKSIHQETLADAIVNGCLRNLEKKGLHVYEGIRLIVEFLLFIIFVFSFF